MGQSNCQKSPKEPKCVFPSKYSKEAIEWSWTMNSTVKTVTLDITKSLIIAPETLGTSAGTWIQPWQMTIRARALYVSAH